MRSITIIGANSYIARNLIHLIDNGENKLYLYDIDENHKDEVGNYTRINFSNTEEYDKINFEVDVIYIFTGKTGTVQGFQEFEQFIDINEKILLQILNTYNKRNSKAKIIFPSTRLVYKGSDELLLEDDEKEFKTIYAMNKYACENYLKMYHQMYEIPYCILRVCVPYGTVIDSAGSYGTVEFFLNKAHQGEDIVIYGDGNQKRTFTHICDLCHIFFEAGINERCMNDVYNVGGETLSIKQIATQIARVYNVGVKSISWPVQAYKLESGDTIFDSTKLDNILQYRYKYMVNDWVREHKKED